MRKSVILFSALLSLFSMTLNAKQKVISMKDYGVYPNRTENISPKIRHILDEIKTKEYSSVILKFEKGEYHFFEDGASVKEYFISNHDQDNPKIVGMAFEGWKNLTLNGHGASFIFHGRMLPMSLLESVNCTFKNFSIDFANPHIAQVEIIENKGDDGIVFQPAPWVKYRVADNGRFETFGETWVAQQSTGIAFDKKTRRLVYNTSDLYFDTSGVTELDNSCLYAPKWKDPKLKNGTIVAMRTWYRPTPGIFLSHNKNTKLENVKVHYAEGMGLLAQLSENITLDGFSVCLKGESDPRYFTTQADATHFSSCKGKIISKNGLYEAMMDDAINVHGTYLKVVKRIDDKTLVGRYMHDQAWGFEWGREGDKVQFVRSQTMELIDSENWITSIEPYGQKETHGAKEFIIKFKKEIESSINESEGFGIENLTWTPEVLFANNTIRNNRARGSLFSTPKKTIIEKNIFDHTSGTAILLCGDCNGWFETGACRNVIIRKNHFINALTNMFQFTNAVISIYPEIPNLDDQKKYFHGGRKNAIRIENNLFETFDEPLLYAKSVDGLLFRKNKVIKNRDYEPFHWNKQPVLLERVIRSVIEY